VRQVSKNRRKGMETPPFSFSLETFEDSIRLELTFLTKNEVP